MKKIILSFYGLLIAYCLSFSQDQITRLNGKIINCEIISIDSIKIDFKTYLSDKLVTTYINVKDVASYKYKGNLIYLNEIKKNDVSDNNIEQPVIEQKKQIERVADPSEKYNCIKLDFVAPIIGLNVNATPMLKCGFERTINRHFSYGLMFSKGEYERTELTTYNNTTVTSSVKAYGIMPEVRCYPFTRQKVAPKGLFLDAHFCFYGLTDSYLDNSLNKTITVKGNVYNAGINIGVKHGGETFIAEYLLGFGISSGKWDKQNNDTELENDYLSYFGTFRFEILLGFMFPRYGY